MTNEEYIESIMEMLRTFSNGILKRIYEYVHKIFIRRERG